MCVLLWAFHCSRVHLLLSYTHLPPTLLLAQDMFPQSQRVPSILSSPCLPSLTPVPMPPTYPPTCRFAQVVMWLEALAAQQLPQDHVQLGSTYRFGSQEGVWNYTLRGQPAAGSKSAGGAELDPDAVSRDQLMLAVGDKQNEQRLAAWAWRLIRAGGSVALQRAENWRCCWELLALGSSLTNCVVWCTQEEKQSQRLLLSSVLLSHVWRSPPLLHIAAAAATSCCLLLQAASRRLASCVAMQVSRGVLCRCQVLGPGAPCLLVRLLSRPQQHLSNRVTCRSVQLMQGVGGCCGGCGLVCAALLWLVLRTLFPSRCMNSGV